MGFEDFVENTKADATKEQIQKEETKRRSKDAWQIISVASNIFEHIPNIEDLCEFSNETGDRSVVIGDEYITPFVHNPKKGVDVALVRNRRYIRYWMPDEGCCDHKYTILIRVGGKISAYARVEENDTKPGSHSAPATLGYAEDAKYGDYKLFMPSSEEQDKETVQLFREACAALEQKYGPLQKPDLKPKDKPIQHLPKRRKEIQPTVPAGWSRANKRSRLFKKK